MSDSTKFSTDYSKRVSKCQKCKMELAKGSVRLAKVQPNFFQDGEGEMKNYFHFQCLFETFKRARATTKVIESADDVDGFSELTESDKKSIIELIDDLNKHRNKSSSSAKSSKQPQANTSKASTSKQPAATSKKIKKNDDDDEDTDVEEVDDDVPKTPKKQILKKVEADNEEDDDDEDNEADQKFETFCKLCDKLSAQSGSTAKTEILKDFISSNKYDLKLLIRFLLPNSSNRVYNLNSVSLVKLYAKVFQQDQDEMIKHLNQGDVANTIKTYFEKSKRLKPLASSKLTLKQVDKLLLKLTQLRADNDQMGVLKEIAERCTPSDLLMIMRLIKKDLRINAGEKVILDGVAENAYNAFKVSRDLDDVIERLLKSPLKKDLSIKINLMKPVKPMLADACKSAEAAIKKCDNGAYVEIKYDGERLQVHKSGNKFEYYSRNLKQVQPHKVEHLKQFIPKAFPFAHDLILDGEVLLYDTKTKKPLPFGTLGVHKKNKFSDALVCYFIFDCIYINGEDLMNKTLKERRKILEKNVEEIPGRIMLSEQHPINKADKLRELMMKAIREGLEGLVIKDVNSKYEPGKRHWLKMKKDYLDEGKMADTADLVVLGAYYGTGNKGGMKSVFLMGVYNEKLQKWQTVTKCGNGFDDKTIDKLQKELDMVEINKDYDKLPSWLDVSRTLVPDFIIRNPKKTQVWEITGAEFSSSDSHTAAGISIRFPRVTRVRDDKSWKEATDLERLKELFKMSKEKTDIDMDEVHKIESDIEESERISEDEDDNPKKSKKHVNKKPVTSPIKSLAVKRSSNNLSENDSNKATVKKQKTQLPAIFSKVKIFIPNECENCDKLKRYIIAYDGEIVDNYEIDDATHIVKLNQDADHVKNSNKNTVYVNIDDLWKSIKMRTKLDTI